MDDAIKTLRAEYKKLLTACGVDAATFNAKVEDLLVEIDDGEQAVRNPNRYVGAAREVAFYEYKVDYRAL